jgi:hypothetical protein
MKRSVVFAAALFALAACASDSEEAAPIELGGAEPAPVAPRDCFSPASISGFNTVDSDTIRVDVGASASYEIDARGAQCANLSFANQIAILPGAATTSICVGDGPLSGTVRTDQGDQCDIQDVRRVGEPAAVAPLATP